MGWRLIGRTRRGLLIEYLQYITFFIDIDITTDLDFQALCYEALKEIIPGQKNSFLLRSKIWKIISTHESQSEDLPSAKVNVVCVSKILFGNKVIIIQELVRMFFGRKLMP